MTPMLEVCKLSKPTVDDYLQQGIHGPKELKPEEKRLYLGTYRERVIIVLTQMQVSEENVDKEVEQLMKENSEAHLFLNGHMNYSFLSKYIQLARKYNITFTVVTNKEYNSPYGLVIAHDYAVNKEDIFFHKNKEEAKEQQATPKKQSFFKKLFKRKK